MKKIKILISAIILILFSFGINIYLANSNNNLRKENSRISENFSNTSNTIDSTYNVELKAYVYKVQSMQLTEDELIANNSELVNNVESLGLKVKNLDGIIDTKISVIADLKKQIGEMGPDNEPGIITQQINDSLFQASYQDTDIIMNQHISLKKIEGISKLTDDDKYIVEVEDLYIKLEPKLLFVKDITYKGLWFWRKVDKMELRVISKNKYVTVNELKEYTFVSKRKGKSISKQQ